MTAAHNVFTRLKLTEEEKQFLATREVDHSHLRKKKKKT